MLLALFKKNSLLFLIANALRVIGVIAMILLLIGQILGMKDNIEGYSRRNQVSVLDTDVDVSSSVASSRTTTSSIARTSTVEPTALSAATTLIQPSSGALAAATEAAQSRAAALEEATQGLPRLAARATSAPQPHFLALASEDEEGLILEDCDYYPNTSVPIQTGGILFTCLYLWLNICALLFLIGSEVAFPWLSNFYTSFFPPLGRDHGLGFLGIFQVYLSAGTLSHQIGTFPAVASWMVFICGLLNVLLGIFFRASLRRTRALVPDADSPVGTAAKGASAARNLFNRFSRAPASKNYASDTYHPDMEHSTAASSSSSSKRDRKVFNISAPMREAQLPMYESGSGATFSKVHFTSQR